MLKQIFTWWSGNTIGAAFDIKRRSGYVGTDEYGNRYFEERKPSLEGRKRRYVMYKGLAEPSKVPADWHGWLHHSIEGAPESFLPPPRIWEKESTPNATGTAQAYLPSGALERGGRRARATGDYEAWTPGE